VDGCGAHGEGVEWEKWDATKEHRMGVRRHPATIISIAATPKAPPVIDAPVPPLSRRHLRLPENVHIPAQVLVTAR
jgi:hypothetical protein